MFGKNKNRKETNIKKPKVSIHSVRKSTQQYDTTVYNGVSVSVFNNNTCIYDNFTDLFKMYMNLTL